MRSKKQEPRRKKEEERRKKKGERRNKNKGIRNNKDEIMSQEAERGTTSTQIKKIHTRRKTKDEIRKRKV